MSQKFEMVAKTLKGLEDVLAEELRMLGAENVQPGCRMVSFEGDLAMMYRANLCCRTALNILRPIYKFIASDPDTLYELVKEYDWGSVLTLGKTFSIDTTSHSNEFTHSRFVTYRVKDAIVDWFKDRFGADKRPGVRLNDADVMLNVHIDGTRVTLSLNSSGESLHKRGWRVAQTEAPINEVLAAGIILKSGWHGESPFVDPMCGSGTFLIEAAMIAAGIKPGSYRESWPFTQWRDWDPELFDSVLHEGATESPCEPEFKIYGSDISPKAIDIAERNILSAGVDEYINLRVRSIQHWDEAPAGGTPGVIVTNPPYGERINPEDIEGLYRTIGTKLKKVFCGYHAWVISSNEDCLAHIGLTPSLREQLQNGGLDCELREYVSFQGSKSEFRAAGGSIKGDAREENGKKYVRKSDAEWTREARDKGMGGKRGDKPSGPRRGLPKDTPLSEKYRPKSGGFARNEERRRKFKEETAREGERRLGYRKPEQPRDEAEELLARRRNVHALKSLGETPKMPSIPPSEGPFMRTRHRWKRPDSSNDESSL